MHSRSVFLCMTGHYNFYYVCMYVCMYLYLPRADLESEHTLGSVGECGILGQSSWVLGALLYLPLTHVGYHAIHAWL